MSREVRRVALGWVHPSDGQYPNGETRHVGLLDRAAYYQELQYARGHGEADPDPADYMPTWNEGTPLGWCLYETVSEGTPVSPVFETEQEFEDWLVADQGMSRPGAKLLIKNGWAPSGVAIGGRFMTGLEFVDHQAATS